MKPLYYFIILFFTLIFSSCTNEKTIKLQLSHQNTYGHFKPALGGISPYPDNENDPWKKTHLSVSGAPKSWTEIKFGDIETNILQSIYQNYLSENITEEKYLELQKSWDWKPDTLELSKDPLKTKIAFAYGKDSLGVTNMIVDANNNLDFSDDKSFIPFNYPSNKEINRDSIGLSNAIDVSFERLVNNKKRLITVPLFITHMSQYNIFMSNFIQHSVADFKGDKIAVCSNDFTNLSYKEPSVVLITDSISHGDKISREKLVGKGEFIEIKGALYKNLGINLNDNTLTLEKTTLLKSELNSTQVGFKSFPFDENDFITESKISLDQFKGKYVLLDFWAVWCGPCIKEMPNLKELYEKTDREKFDIIGIVGDSPKKALKKIIEKDTINWPQILSTDSNKIKETFGIHGYPTTFLINPEGIIIAKNLRGKALENKVLELISQ